MKTFDVFSGGQCFGCGKIVNDAKHLHEMSHDGFGKVHVCSACKRYYTTHPAKAKEVDILVDENETRKARNARARANRKAREQALKDCGLKKVRGNLGGTYYE